MRLDRLVTAAVISLFGLFGGSVGADDLPALRAKGRLRVIVSTHAASTTVSLKPGTPPGFEREMIEGFAALHRLRPEFVPVESTNDRIPALLAGKGDVVVGGVGVVEERRKLVDFTTDVFPARHLVVTWSPQPAIRTLDELRRVRVGVTKGSSWASSAKAVGVPAENLDDSYGTAEEVFRALRSHKIAAAVMSVAWALLEKRQDPKIELGLFLDVKVGQAWAVRKEDGSLLRALDEHIINMKRSGSWSRLIVKYYGEYAVEFLKPGQTGS
jgi:membrane-bound lytic murein transglycosylase F